tara:strand:- start:383 stop:646 length:264 start_codon:yes stop_codon:yes gene_type:complete
MFLFSREVVGSLCLVFMDLSFQFVDLLGSLMRVEVGVVSGSVFNRRFNFSQDSGNYLGSRETLGAGGLEIVVDALVDVWHGDTITEW